MKAFIGRFTWALLRPPAREVTGSSVQSYPANATDQVLVIFQSLFYSYQASRLRITIVDGFSGENSLSNQRQSENGKSIQIKKRRERERETCLINLSTTLI